MGRGVAKQALNQYPGIDFTLGKHIRENGNLPGILYDRNYPHSPIILSFPVKPSIKIWKSDAELVPHMRGKFGTGARVPGWACLADIVIIERSCRYLRIFAENRGFRRVALPRPGCGNGGLRWEEVKPVLYRWFEDSPVEFDIYSIND